MKKLLLLFILFTGSCQKFNAVVKKWRVQEGHDRMPHGHAFFCTKDAWLKIDTIDVYYTVEPSGPYSVWPGTSSLTLTSETPDGTNDTLSRYYFDALNIVE